MDRAPYANERARPARDRSSCGRLKRCPVLIPDPSGPLHTAEEMRQISDLAHWIEGAVVMLAAVLAIWGATSASRAAGNGIRPDAESPSWAIVILGAGIVLTFFLVFPHHGINRAREQWKFVFGDPQQRQHVVIAALLIAGAASEVLYRTRRGFPRLLAYLWPASAGSIGLLFALHTQHGTTESVARAVLLHRALAFLFIGAALIRAAQILSGGDLSPRSRYRWLSMTWPALLLAASVLLLSYREPVGAFGAPHSTGTVSPHPR